MQKSKNEEETHNDQDITFVVIERLDNPAKLQKDISDLQISKIFLSIK